MVIGITAEELVLAYPKLYHMAELGSWPSIAQHGLRSTSALLDLFEIEGDGRRALEACHRPESVPVLHQVHGRAVIRDQKPMSENGLAAALEDGLVPTEWYKILNAKVFFWLTESRLNKLLDARPYRNKRHTVLLLSTAQLVALHHNEITLSALNSGCTKPYPHKRGIHTFRRMAEYPYESRKKYRDTIVQLAVEYSVPNIADCVIEVSERGAGQESTTIWRR